MRKATLWPTAVSSRKEPKPKAAQIAQTNAAAATQASISRPFAHVIATPADRHVRHGARA
jgi:hypothetical protein